MVLDAGRKTPVPSGSKGGKGLDERDKAGSPAESAPRRQVMRLAAFSPMNLLIYLGVILGLIGALAFSWVNVKISFILQIVLPFKLWENAWLLWITVALLVAILLLIHWKPVGGWAAVIGGAGCLAIIGIYIYAMATKAFRLLGLLKNIPVIGGPLSDFARNITSVSPAAGFILFVVATLLILTGGILLVRRKRSARSPEELPQVRLPEASDA